ncbi:MAG: hypothetical protein HC869_01255, partial [Rhodospirillales bacterium]|nr:hypothetical protein [Rhodospirillales bacterium]
MAAPSSPSGPVTTPKGPKASTAAFPDEVVRLAITPRAAPMFQVGAPRLRLVARQGIRFNVPIAIHGGVIAAADGDATLGIWDMSSGKLLRRVVDPQHAKKPVFSVALSDSGKAVAVRLGDENYLLRFPFTGEPVSLPCAPFDISKDDKRALCAELVPAVLDLATRKVLTSAPRSPLDKGGAGEVVFSQNERFVFFGHEGGILRWDYQGTGAVTSALSLPGAVIDAVFAKQADVALLLTKSGHHYHYADLLTGKVSAIPDDGRAYSITPSGRAIVALRRDTFVALDVSGKPATTLVVDPEADGPIAFDNDERTFAYVATRSASPTEEIVELRVVDQGRGVRSYPSPTRFAGWTPNNQAIVEQGARRGLFAPATEQR